MAGQPYLSEWHSAFSPAPAPKAASYRLLHTHAGYLLGGFHGESHELSVG